MSRRSGRTIIPVDKVSMSIPVNKLSNKNKKTISNKNKKTISNTNPISNTKMDKDYIYSQIDSSQQLDVKSFQSVLVNMTNYLKTNYSKSVDKPKINQVSVEKDKENKTFNINLFTSIEFLSKIPADGFHDFLTMGRNETFKNVKSEFIFIYILGNFMKNISAMETVENQNKLIENTLYVYAGAMNLLKSEDGSSGKTKNLGDGNDIAHRVMTLENDSMPGTGKGNKIGQVSKYQSDEDKTTNLLYFIDDKKSDGNIFKALYDSWLELCNEFKINLDLSKNSSTNRTEVVVDATNKINIHDLFEKACKNFSPQSKEWYIINFVIEDTLKKYTKDYVTSLYVVFLNKYKDESYTLEPTSLPVTTIPYLLEEDNYFLKESEIELRDMEFGLAKLLFKENNPIYFFADANKGKVGPGILEILRSQPVLLVENRVIDMDEASEGFSKTTQELNKVYNSVIVQDDSFDNYKEIIEELNEGKKFTFNFYSEEGSFIEEFTIYENNDQEYENFYKKVLEIDALKLKEQDEKDFIQKVIKLYENKFSQEISPKINEILELSSKGSYKNRILEKINENKNSAKLILTQIKNNLMGDSKLKITNQFISQDKIQGISVNNMANLAIDNLNGSSAEDLINLKKTIIKEFGGKQGGDKRSFNETTLENVKKPKFDTKDQLIKTIQRFLLPLTAKRSGDLLPLCLWGFLKDKPNKVYDTGDLNAYELGLLLLTFDKNVSLFQNLLLACPGTDDMQDFLRLVRCGDNSDLFTSNYYYNKDSITLKPLYECIPMVFNPNFIPDENSSKSPCLTSLKETIEVNKSQYFSEKTDLETPLSSPVVNEEDTNMVTDMVTDKNANEEDTNMVTDTDIDNDTNEENTKSEIKNDEDYPYFQPPDKNGGKRKKKKTLKRMKQKIKKTTIKKNKKVKK